MRKLFFTVFFILSVDNCFAQLIPDGWFQQGSNVITTLNSVYFLNSLTGWSIGNNGVILHTADGGSYWEHQSSSVSNDLKKVFFSSLHTGYVIGTSGLILKSTNSGSSWYQQISGTINNLTSCSFTNDITGYVSGLSNTLLKTTNGGINWNSISFEDSVDYYSVYFINNSTGWLSSVKSYAVSSDTAFILKTTNGGETWIDQYPQLNDAAPILSLQFTDSLNGYCTYQFGTISGTGVLKTTNGGNSWITSGGFNGGDYQLHFINNLKGWSSGADNSIYRTNNGGVNWTRSNAFHILSFFFRSIFFTDSLTGWTVGYEGKILKTTTGGILTSYTNTNSEILLEDELEQNYPNPFNPKTVINYQIPFSSEIKIKIYNVLGNEIETLVNEKLNSGSYSVTFEGSDYPSGVYLYRLVIDGNVMDTKRMVLLK